MDQNREQATLAEALEVSESGFAAHRHKAERPRRQRDAQLRPLIWQSFEQSRRTYGRSARADRVCASPESAAVRIVSPDSCGRAVCGPRKSAASGPAPPTAGTATKVADNNWLAEVPAPDRPGQIWQSDITRLETQEGWLYLAFTLDAYSRRCVAHHCREDIWHQGLAGHDEDQRHSRGRRGARGELLRWTHPARGARTSRSGARRATGQDDPSTALRTDRGYRGAREVGGTQILVPGKAPAGQSKSQRQAMRQRFRRRCAIEPTIAHLKSDFRLARNYLRGFAGDSLNLMLAAAAWNFRKWLQFWRPFFQLLILALPTSHPIASKPRSLFRSDQLS